MLLFFSFYQYRYRIDKLDQERSFVIDLSVLVCIDGTCIPVQILSQLSIPMPSCNTNGTLALPGGSIEGYLNQVPVGGITDVTVDLILNSLGIKVRWHFNKNITNAWNEVTC